MNRDNTNYARGVSILMILVCHIAAVMLPQSVARLMTPLGGIGVAVFLVISGYGNNESYWRDLVSNLRLCGYDKVLSIEHEDSVMSIDEGLRKAINFLKNIIIEEEKPTTMSWA